MMFQLCKQSDYPEPEERVGVMKLSVSLVQPVGAITKSGQKPYWAPPVAEGEGVVAQAYHGWEPLITEAET